jgi:hypothetical protein
MTARKPGEHPGRKPPGPPAFSDTLQTWLETSQDKTLAGLIDVFAEKSFAILFLLCLCIAALPLPTAGVTHILEIIAILLSLELIVGRKTVWLPKKWSRLDIGKFVKGKAITRLIAVIRWFERYSRRRGSRLLGRTWMLSLVGLLVLLLSFAALVAIPFSGLDTLPALGAVVISLSLILEDILFLLAGLLIGTGGIALEISVGAAAFKGLTHFF